MAQRIISKKGREKFVHNGYIYVFDRCSSRDPSIKFWRCERKNSCKGRIHTKDGEVINEINQHGHGSSAASVEAAHVKCAIKHRATETLENTSTVINQCLTEVSQAAHGVLPRMDTLKKTVRRTRNEAQQSPCNPDNLFDLQIPDRYKIYKGSDGNEEEFLIADSGPSANRILVFGRKSWVRDILCSSDMWYADGTFNLAPPLFSQVYVILAKKLGGVQPIIYALLPNKQRVTYIKLFDLIKEAFPEVAPKSIFCDFEQGAISAMKESFLNVEIKGCFYHLSHNLHKTLRSKGMSHSYNNDAGFALKTKMILALCFVPVNDMDSHIDALSIFLPNELQELLNWFEDNYIGRPNRNRQSRRPAVFKMEMWNLYNRTLNQEDKTNNHAEAAHRRIYSELCMHHPTIWRFIEGIKCVQKGRDAAYEQLLAGHSPQHKLKKYILAEERIRRIVSDYGTRQPLEYLRGLAHNFELN